MQDINAIVQAVYQSTFNNITAHGQEFPCGFVFQWVHKGRFIRVPRYQDPFCSFAPATAFVKGKGNGHIVVVNSYGHRKLFQDPEIAGVFLAEV